MERPQCDKNELQVVFVEDVQIDNGALLDQVDFSNRRGIHTQRFWYAGERLCQPGDLKGGFSLKSHGGPDPV